MSRNSITSIRRSPVSLYFVVPPSDISRTKPLIRLMLNQIGRRLTEDLEAAATRRNLLLMLDEFPAFGRLDFFESALAFMTGYRIRAFLIAQSLNQIEKAYGPNNSILDNCQVRIAVYYRHSRHRRRCGEAMESVCVLPPGHRQPRYDPECQRHEQGGRSGSRRYPSEYGACDL
ncbi:hypothetical protein A0U92_12505 [Acetobacter aceti]|uniref:TraD/TraG TraM recognition site domain-containing protein n=1 Tax=Acetobacter aceti TaxID=435 RepID=A0A1U9KI83_ACEAC|nr:hypothetical protein A0U92_12505 [Acetobacter aceti]